MTHRSTFGGPVGRRTLLGLALVVTAVMCPAIAVAATAPGFGQARHLCSVEDARLPEVSGLAADTDVLLAMNDKGGEVYTLDRSCRITSQKTIKMRLVDVEDLALAADGSVWLSDTGGNRQLREEVRLIRWDRRADVVTSHSFRYPKGGHDAEALLMSPFGTAVLVTKSNSGVSDVFTADQPFDPVKPNPLVHAGKVDVRELEYGAGSPGASLVTGGGVSPDGTRVVLRTYAAAYEWDAPDGDLARAITSTEPRVIKLPQTRQGEAITYAADGYSLVTATEGLPAPVHVVPLGAPQRAETPVDQPLWPSVLPVAAAAAAVTLVAQIVVSVRSRAARGRRRKGTDAHPTPPLSRISS